MHARSIVAPAGCRPVDDRVRTLSHAAASFQR